MGGHGGLNILPQKRWNVYNQDNRYRVAEDEEKARQKAAAEKRKKIDAGRESRRKLLLDRVGGEVGDGDSSIAGEKVDKELDQFRREVEKEHKESRKRGKKAERTSDAKFDERFKFAYGLQDKKPWYILPRDPTAISSSALQSNAEPNDEPKKESTSGKRAHRGQEEKASHKEKSHKKSSRKKSKKRKAEALLAGLHATKACDSLHVLRKERLQRERREREKARDLLNK